MFSEFDTLSNKLLEKKNYFSTQKTRCEVSKRQEQRDSVGLRSAEVPQQEKRSRRKLNLRRCGSRNCFQVEFCFDRTLVCRSVKFE